MKYYRIANGSKDEITKDEALRIVLGSYRDNDMSRDMLTVPNLIHCRFSDIEVREGDMVLMAGLCNMLPDDVSYDDDGNRI